MIPAYWPFETPNQFGVTRDSTGSPQDQLASFAPAVGPPITRRRTTARVEQWNLSVLLETAEQFYTFEAWFDDTLKGGSLPFTWRVPYGNRLARFQFAPATYTPSFLGGEWVRVGFSALVLPGTLPLAPYVAEDRARLPDWVADYDADLYWLDGDPVAASALAGVSGAYLVLQNVGGTLTYQTATYATDVPQTAPTPDTLWLAGYAQ